MKYYIEEVDPAEWRNVATSKARVDIFNILDSLGYEKITVAVPINPNSSPITAKIKSVCCSAIKSAFFTELI